MSGLSAESTSKARAGHDDGPLSAIDLFAGVGGSSAGATAVGIKVVAAVDCWALARDTYKANFQDVQFFDSKVRGRADSEVEETTWDRECASRLPECTSHTCAKGSAPRSELSRRTAFQVTRFARAFKPVDSFAAGDACGSGVGAASRVAPRNSLIGTGEPLQNRSNPWPLSILTPLSPASCEFRP